MNAASFAPYTRHEQLPTLKIETSNSLVLLAHSSSHTCFIYMPLMVQHGIPLYAPWVFNVGHRVSTSYDLPVLSRCVQGLHAAYSNNTTASLLVDCDWDCHIIVVDSDLTLVHNRHNVESPLGRRTHLSGKAFGLDINSLGEFRGSSQFSSSLDARLVGYSRCSCQVKVIRQNLGLYGRHSFRHTDVREQTRKR